MIERKNFKLISQGERTCFSLRRTWQQLRTMGDAALGAFIIVVSVLCYTYYSVWILMTPWLETSPDLASWLEYFPDRYYALALPALLLVFVLTCAITFIGSVLSSAGLLPHYLQSPSGNRDIGGARRMHLSPKRDTPVSMSKSSRSEGKPSASCIFDTINSEKEVVGTPDVRTRGAHRRVKTVS